MQMHKPLKNILSSKTVVTKSKVDIVKSEAEEINNTVRFHFLYGVNTPQKHTFLTN